MPATWTSVQAQSGGVEILNFRGSVHPLRKIVQLVWWASEDAEFATHVVEHSLDGVNFQPIGEVPAIFTGATGHIYNFWHPTAHPRLNYYRLYLVFNHGLNSYSETIKVSVGAPPIFTYPTYPGASGPSIRPLTSGDEDEWNEAILSDIYGRPIMRMRSDETDLRIENLPTGIYILNARYTSGWRTSTFVVNNN